MIFWWVVLGFFKWAFLKKAKWVFWVVFFITTLVSTEPQGSIAGRLGFGQNRLNLPGTKFATIVTVYVVVTI